ncbi:MAG TPA: ABC transporter permease [Acidimicrobiales bacterium]
MITQSTGQRVVRQRRLVLYKAFLRRDFAMAFSYRLPFAVDIFQSVLSVAFLYFLARVVGHKVLAESQLKVSYFGFAVIGTIMVGILTVNLTTFSKRVRADQLTGTLEVLFSMPVKPWLVILASASYQVIYAIISATLSIGLAFWLGLRFHVTALSLLVGVGDFVSTMILFAALGMALAAFVMVFKRGETLTTLLIGGLSLIGGVLYPVSLLSTPLRQIAENLPFTWALEVMRAALLGGQADYLRLIELSIFTIVLYPIAIFVFTHALHRAKRSGSVGQY